MRKTKAKTCRCKYYVGICVVSLIFARAFLSRFYITHSNSMVIGFVVSTIIFSIFLMLSVYAFVIWLSKGA